MKRVYECVRKENVLSRRIKRVLLKLAMVERVQNWIGGVIQNKYKYKPVVGDMKIDIYKLQNKLLFIR